jgi:hypothetical protein
MTDIAEMVLALLFILLASVVTWHARTQAAHFTVARTKQLDEAADLLNLHARSLQRFLSDPDAPYELSALLVEFSDVMCEREAVARLSEWAVNRPFEQPMDTEETQALSAIVTDLRARNIDLAERFDAAVITAVAGASLRWPESAALFALTFPRLLFTPKRDVAIAVTVTHLRSGMPFSLKPSVPTMA